MDHATLLCHMCAVPVSIPEPTSTPLHAKEQMKNFFCVNVPGEGAETTGQPNAMQERGMFR